MPYILRMHEAKAGTILTHCFTPARPSKNTQTSGKVMGHLLHPGMVHPENVWHDLPRGGTIRVVGAHRVPVREGRCALLRVELKFDVVGELVLNLQKPKARAIRNLTRVFS
jgi:hypothetical protein